MYFVGIDIAKHQHEACIIDDAGALVAKSLRFANNQSGGQKFLSWVAKAIGDCRDLCIGMESTGHYWLALYSFIRREGHCVQVINPIQSDAFRNLYIRQTKTDTKDAFIIAELLRFGRYSAAALPEERLFALKQLCRFRFSVTDTIGDLKRRAIGLLDLTFPEYETLFADIFGKTSSALLLEYTTPDELTAVDTEKLADFLARQSRNRLGIDKAVEIQKAAQTSFGIDMALDAFRLQLRLLIEQIRFAETHLAFLDEEIETRLVSLNTNLVTIPGVGPVLAATMLAEIGDISRFSTSAKLVAFAGIDPSVRQSGDFTGTRNHMSKRGSPYLRRALWLAAVSARRYNPPLKEFYQQKIAEGKHVHTATGAVARKLTNIVHAMLRDNSVFSLRP